MTSDNITMKEVDGVMTFSCGCKAKRVGKNFFIAPCLPDCEVYQYCLDESKKRGNEITVHFEEDFR